MADRESSEEVGRGFGYWQASLVEAWKARAADRTEDMMDSNVVLLLVH